MVKTYAYGFPRIGKNREYKKTIESFWKNKINTEELFFGIQNIENENESRYKEKVDLFPTNEMTMYDKMLDTAIMVGLYNPQDMKEYYELCRGKNCLEMTKWFNTNYHYLVPDFSEWVVPTFFHQTRFQINGENPHLIGPFTFLKLSKGLEGKSFEDFALKLSCVYSEIIENYEMVHIDEPAFVMDLTSDEIKLIKQMYDIICDNDTKVNLFTYYEDVDWLQDFVDIPVDGIGLDFVNGKHNLKNIKDISFPKNKTLFAGFVDGINVWKTPIFETHKKLQELSNLTDDIYVTNAGPLYHLPVTLDGENKLSTFLIKSLSFATEKLDDLNYIKNNESFNYRKYNGDINTEVQNRINNLKDDDFVKSIGVEERRKIQDEILNLPDLPTTTIGSFPQSKEVRRNRLDFKKGRISEEIYNHSVDEFTEDAIDIQEEIGMDVLVHGEFERTDMVEHFCQRMDGVANTDNGWIISYGTRAYRPSIIHSDVSRPKQMTIREVEYAQTLTDKPMKGMLTSAGTIIAWDFVRKDIPISEGAYQISLCLQDEIRDYERAGINIVQVDEPAFREIVPIKKRYHDEYFDWAIKSFNLATNTSPKTQIHSHMCYSEFNEIVDEINQLDFDVMTIECSRSGGEIIEAFENIDFKRQIGLGVWDIHSPAIPTVDDMVKIVKRALKVIPMKQFWINPDCGLKTRDWPETKQSMINMVECRKRILGEING